MARRKRDRREALIRRIMASEFASYSVRYANLRLLRKRSEEDCAAVDHLLLRQIDRMRAGLLESRKLLAEIEAVVTAMEQAQEKRSQAPLHPATFLGFQQVGGDRAALVSSAAGHLVVRLADSMEGEELVVGDSVLLAAESKLLVAKVSSSSLCCGETACFERWTEDGRMVLSYRDEEIVVAPGGSLCGERMARGDLVRWNPRAKIALEKIDQSRVEHAFLSETPEVSFADIGGLDAQIEQLKNLVIMHFLRPDLARRYKIPPQCGILLIGPPGVGKTMLVKGLVNWLGSVSPGGRAKFINVKPGQLGSMYYSRTEAKIRRLFKVAREVAAAQPEVPVVIFLDELDWIASSRRGYYHRADERAVTALAVELDGLEERGNIMVLGATNRQGVLDPALIRPGRFGDHPIVVGRPKRKAAEDILVKYLPEGVVYRATGSRQPIARQEAARATVSRLFSSQSGDEVAFLTFRDGRRRAVWMKELMSGAVLAKIAYRACRRGCERELETGQDGVWLDDLLAAVEEEREHTARLLEPSNCSLYLDDLPQDVDVVGVEPGGGKPRNATRFFVVA